MLLTQAALQATHRCTPAPYGTLAVLPTGAAEGYRSIGVNARDGERADPDGIELGSGAVVPSHDEVVDLEIVGNARGVGSKKALVDLELAGVPKGKEVSNVGDVD